MEASIFLFDAIAIVALVVFGLRNDKMRPGERLAGPFRYRQSVEREAAGRATPDYLKSAGRETGRETGPRGPVSRVGR